MPLVAFDTNVVDLWAEIYAPDLADTIEACEPPPRSLQPSAYSVYWLVAMAPRWPSVLYTFSDSLYEEVVAMPTTRREYAKKLLGLAAEIRQSHPEEYRVVDHSIDPTQDVVASIGLSPSDARHIADAIRIGADDFLTCDKGILKRAYAINTEWVVRVLLPEVFLLLSVRRGAPWPASVPWPWEHRELSETAERLGFLGDMTNR